MQNPARLAPFLYAVHGGRPRVLREDFCGTGGVCRAWVAMGSPPLRGGMGTPPLRGGMGTPPLRGGMGTPPLRGGDTARSAVPPRSAIGVDMDPEPLQRLQGVAGVKAVRANVMDCHARADVISATNFPIGYWHTRRELLAYLQACRARLRRGGVFICDTYGGATAFTRGTLTRDIWTDDGIRIRYTWEQREADPLTGMVVDVLHFRADRRGEVLYQEADAFVYHWRLWSIPELRDAMAEAGFSSSDVYSELADAIDSDGNLYVRPVQDPRELEESFIVLIAAKS